MYARIGTIRILVFLLFISLVTGGATAQKKKKEKTKPQPAGKAVMWEPENIERLDLFNGPGGEKMRPDLSKIEFIKEEKKGYNKKYRIRDGSGQIWVAKLGREAKPEIASVRLLWGLGYKSEINYYVPTITIPGKGTFKDVRLEARPADVNRLDEWKWRNNPFNGTKELQGLKMMMVFLANWDVLDLQNQILQVSPSENDYVVSDLGSTLGKLGNNNLPLFYRLGRKVGNPKAYLKGHFIRRVKNGKIELAYKGKNRDLFKDVSMNDARWLADLLARLSDKQIRDAFRAANYSSTEIETYLRAVKNRINELERATGENLAEK